MPKVPSKVKLSGRTITVKERDTFDDGRHGHFDYFNQMIEYSEDITDALAASTIIHELLHAMISNSHLRHKLSRDLEEEVVLAFESSLVDLINNNPKLIKYFMSTLK